jgi:cellulose synthase (UDP-forming)
MDIVEGTIRAAKRIDYKNKEIYVLDDSDKKTKIRAINRLSKKHNITVLRRPDRAGFKAGNINAAIPRTKCKYFAIFDSDQQAKPNFLAELIPIMEANKDLAFIQTPQRTRNIDNYVEKGASADQNVFYDNICEGKSVVGAQFCCGSNVLFRKKALLSIKRKENNRNIYMEEWCVTEDFATSVLLHDKGWESLYYTGTHAKGLAPGSLAAYNTQRGRWAVGTISTLKKNFFRILFGRFSLHQKWEYLMSGTFYLVGLANFLMLINAIVLILFNIPIYYTLPFVLFFSNVSTFYYSIYVREKSLRDLFCEQTLSFFSFPLYLKSLITAILGKKISFKVTEKTASGSRSPSLALQLTTFIACLSVLLFGIITFLVKKQPFLLFNSFWLAYQSLLLGFGILSLKNLSTPRWFSDYIMSFWLSDYRLPLWLSHYRLSLLRRIILFIRTFKLRYCGG